MAPSSKPPAAMSSRLLTMKFMQRAAASPTSSTASTPDNRSSKRQRLSNGSFKESPTGTPTSDSEAVQQVLAAEERKRQEAVDREAARRGETKWVLDVKTPSKAPNPSSFSIVSAGYSALDARDSKDDSSDDKSTTTPVAGRRSFGVPATTNDITKAGDTEGTDEEDDDPDPRSRQAGEAARQQRDAKRRREQSLSKQLANDRRGKQLNLNKLTSISGGGTNRSSSNIVCHKCGKSGHIKARCPQ